MPLAPGSIWTGPSPCSAESGLSRAPAALVRGSSKHGSGHCPGSPPRSSSPGFLFDHFLGLENGKTQTCSALHRVPTTSLLFSCHLTFLAEVPRAQPKSKETVAMCGPARRARGQQKTELTRGKGERVRPQLTLQLEKDILFMCTLQIFPLGPKGERENVP